jgi:hypothetical protein
MFKHPYLMSALGVGIYAGTTGDPYLSRVDYGGIYGSSIGELVSGTLSGENWMVNIGAGLAFDMAGRNRLMSGVASNPITRQLAAGRIISSKKFGSRNSVRELKRIGAGKSKLIYKEAQKMAGARLGTRGANIGLMRAGYSKGAVKNINLGLKLKGLGKFIGFAPLAFMAFDLVANAFNAPIPLRPPVPIRTTALPGTFYDTGIAYTQRKRALEMIHNSQYTGRSALANEASLIHQ